MSTTTNINKQNNGTTVNRKYRHRPGGHEVVVVEHLDEGLDLGPLGDLLLAHGCGHLTGIAVDACDQSVAVRTVGCAIVNVLQRDNKKKVLWYHHDEEKHGWAGSLCSFLQFSTLWDLNFGEELVIIVCVRSCELHYRWTWQWMNWNMSTLIIFRPITDRVLPWRWQLCARRSVQLGPSPPSQASWTCPFLPQRQHGQPPCHHNTINTPQAT